MKHQYSFDLRAITNRLHRMVVWGALAACDYPFQRIRRRTRKRVPVSVSDLGRFAAELGAEGAHAHIEGGHLLGDPARRAALGLYWLPTSEHPAGRIELEQSIIGDTALAQEVFLAEAAHAVDYGVPLSDEQRQQIATIVHGGDPTPHGTHGWFEERGGTSYFGDWLGEVWMSLFMRAFAPALPRPLEARQPWTHRVDDAMATQIRALLS